MAFVLVIDDTRIVREAVRQMLESANHTVIEANDGQVGLRLFHEKHPDLVITDLVMPNMDGIEIIRELRRTKGKTKIIAMSATSIQSGAPYLTAAKKLGADAILAKPFAVPDLLTLVDELLDAGESAGSPRTDTEIDLTLEITEPRLLRLYHYWLDRRGERRFPARRDIDPLDFGYVLGYVLLIDVLRDPLRFRVRLHGTTMAERAGYELTGKLLSELPDAKYRDYVIERCEGLVASGMPVAVRHERLIDGRFQPYEALWLPFSEDAQNVTMLLCALIYDFERGALK